MWAIKLNLNRTVKEQGYGTIAGKEMNPGNGFFKLISFAIFNCKKDHPNVYIGYYSLPDWLSVISEHIIKVSFVVSWLERFLHLRLLFFLCSVFCLYPRLYICHFLFVSFERASIFLNNSFSCFLFSEHDIVRCERTPSKCVQYLLS